MTKRYEISVISLIEVIVNFARCFSSEVQSKCVRTEKNTVMVINLEQMRSDI